jgi:hypothetical protein
MKKIKLQLFCLFVLFQFINFFFSKTIKLFSFRFLKWINFISNSLLSHFRYRNRHDSIGNRQEGRISVNGKCSQKVNSKTLDVRMGVAVVQSSKKHGMLLSFVSKLVTMLQIFNFILTYFVHCDKTINCYGYKLYHFLFSGQ